MKAILIILVIFTYANTTQILASHKETNLLKNELYKPFIKLRNTYHMTTNFNLFLRDPTVIYIKKHPNCPPDENPTNSTLLPYPSDCTIFYRCYFGYAYPAKCPLGLEWSIDLKRCDFPEIAKCVPLAKTTLKVTHNVSSETSTNPIETTTLNNEEPIKHQNCPIDEDPNNPTHLFYPGDCGKFYKCSGGYAYPMNCPSGLEWSIELDRCEFPEVAKCDPNASTTLRTTNNPETTTEPIETTTPNNEEPIKHQNCPIDEDPNNPTHLFYPGDCGKFYKCSGGYAYPMNCPSGLEWSIELDRCEFPEVAKCDPNASTTLRTTNNPETTTEPIETTTPNNEEPIKHQNCPIDEDPNNPIHLFYPGDCGKFYKCSGGYAYPMNCPSGLEWSIELDRCEFPEVAKCNPNASTTLRTTQNANLETSTKPVVTTTIANKNKPIKYKNCPNKDYPTQQSFLHYPGDCTKFYICSGEYAFPMDCPIGLEWNNESSRCDVPELAKCDPYSTTTLQTNETSIPETSTKPVETTTKSIETTTKPVETTAQSIETTTQSVETTTQTVETTTKLIEIETTTPIQKTDIKHTNCPTIDDPAKPIHLPYPGDCGKFYKCSKGYALQMNCPNDLEWSIELDRCDFPEIAKCNPEATTTLISDTDPVHRTDQPDEDKAFRHPSCPLFDNPELERNSLIYLRFPDKCHKYFKCAQGFAVPRNCPHGLHWSTQYSRCEWPDRADCFQEKLKPKY